jgi:hypothetical protein
MSCGARAQILFSDDFNGSTVNSNLWNVLLPYGDSSVTQGNGYVSVENNGRLTSVTNLPTNYEIDGRFLETANPHDNFKIVVRSDGLRDGSEARGIAFQFNIENDTGETTNNLRIFSIGNTNGDFTTPEVAASLTLDTWHTFRITDDGCNLALYFDGAATPNVTAQSKYAVGHLVTCYNREGLDGGSSISANGITEIDSVTVVSEPQLTIFTAIELGFITQTGTIYQIQASPDLATWTNFDGQIQSTNGDWFKTYSIRGQPRLFYRVQIVQ